jgi:hypothetical protein
VQVFLSHASAGDGALCAHLASELARHRVKAWFSNGQDAISPGEDWERRLRSEIDRSDVLVVLASRHIHDSRWCRLEAQYATSMRKHVLVVRVDDHPLPGWIPFLAGDRQHLSLLRMPLHVLATHLAQLCHDAMDGHLGAEDVVELVELGLPEACRGVQIPVTVPQGRKRSVVSVRVPPCGQSQVVRIPLGGESTLSLHVRVRASETFQLLPNGRDLLTVVTADARTLGNQATLSVPTLEGLRQIAVPENRRRPGARIRLKGGGVGIGGKDAGDLVVEIHVQGSAPPSIAETDEFLAMHRRLGVWATIMAWAAPASALLAGVGLGSGFAWLATLFYGLVGVWLGLRSLAERRQAAVDWIVGVGSMACLVPFLGPALLLWCGWELPEASTHPRLRKLLAGHAIAAIAVWAVVPAVIRGDEPQWVWRGLVSVLILIAGGCLVRLRPLVA